MLMGTLNFTAGDAGLGGVAAVGDLPEIFPGIKIPRKMLFLQGIVPLNQSIFNRLSKWLAQ